MERALLPRHRSVRPTWTLVLLLLAQLIIATDILPGICLPDEPRPGDPYSYLIALTDALAMGKQAQERIPGPAGSDDDPIEAAGKTMLGLKLAKADYECAAKILSGYKSSPNTAIKTSSDAGAIAFTLLAMSTERTVASLARLIDAEGQGMGSHLAESSQIAADIDEALKMLVPATAAATYSIVVAEPGSDKLTRLALTAAERSEIQRRLKATFGPSVQGGMKAGQLPLLAAAAAFYGVVADPRWQSTPSH
jgi:hypothetical protein